MFGAMLLNWNMLFFIAISRTFSTRSAGKSSGSCSLHMHSHFLIVSKPWSVLMMVHITTASAVEIKVPGGKGPWDRTSCLRVWESIVQLGQRCVTRCSW